LLPQAIELIEKYRDDPRSLNNSTVFPVFSNQRMNSYLKEIPDLCGITKKLTFHIARHTLATTVALSNGVPTESVSKMLGHTSIRTTQIYAKVVEHKLNEDMRNLEQRMSASVPHHPKTPRSFDLQFLEICKITRFIVYRLFHPCYCLINSRFGNFITSFHVF
jgi:hypothetical protein